MPKFRKKPVVVEAERYDPFARPLQKGVCVGKCPPVFSTLPHLHTAHKNQQVILVGDEWIIAEPDGEHFYPVKPDIFAATYEPVTE